MYQVGKNLIHVNSFNLGSLPDTEEVTEVRNLFSFGIYRDQLRNYFLARLLFVIPFYM